MNVFEHAMKMEQDGRAFYLEHAAKITEPSLKRILEELADDEQKHYNLFKAMNDQHKAIYGTADMTTIFSTARNAFEELRDQNRDFSFPKEARKAWEVAADVEKKSEAFYREKAREMTDESQKQLWNAIADEEHRHWNTIEHVIQFLDRPKQWLADAEWTALED
jgi:rubrerythrin